MNFIMVLICLVLTACLIISITIVELTKKGKKLKLAFVGILFVLAIIFLFVSAIDYNIMLNPDTVNGVVDFPKWLTFLYFSFCILVISVYYALIKLLNKQEKE